MAAASLASRRAALAVISSALSFAPPVRADPMALWRIVHDHCVPNVQAGRRSGAVRELDLARDDAAQGVAILKDLVGVAQMLAIPTRRITGIEDPQMLEPDAPKVFADAWKAKALLEARLGHPFAARGGRARDQLEMGAQPGPVARPYRLRRQAVGEALGRLPFGARRRWRAMTDPAQGTRLFCAAARIRPISPTFEPLRLLADEPRGGQGPYGRLQPRRDRRDVRWQARGSSCSPTAFLSRGAVTPRTSRTMSCAIASSAP